MKIKTAGIPPEGITIEEEEDPARFNLKESGVELISPIRCRVRARLVGQLLLVRGEIVFEGRFSCSRCLEKFNRVVEIKDFQVQIPVTNPDGLIDLTDKIREDIILALPYKPLCSEGCRGLCPICGINLNQGSCDCRNQSSDNPFSQLT